MTAQSSAIHNTNRWETRQLVTMALLCAIGVLLSFVEFPLFPPAPWLKYDASFVPALVCGFAYGAGPGLAVGIVEAIIHGIIMGDFYGAVMNVLVTVAYVAPAALVYRKSHTFAGAIIGLVASIVCAVAFAVVGNIIITPLYAGVTVDAVIAMILPILVPFNLIKAVLNSVITLIVYKSISNLITPKKDQVKGR